MAETSAEGEPEPTPAWHARMLLRAAKAATLATVADGQPFASLVTPACAPDLSLLLWISMLSEHTRHLRADPRCSVLVAGAPASANPQTAPRVTVTGLAETIEDDALKARWLARHPYAALYASFGDFSLVRIRIMGALYVGGFARAHRLRVADLSADPLAIDALLAAEGSILSHCNADHADALHAIAQAAGGAGDGWRMTAADVDGCDLSREDDVLRIHWRAPVTDAGAVRAELVRLARAARAAGAN